MCYYLDPDEVLKVRKLTDTRQRNNDFRWMLCDYLNSNPRSITKELMDQVDPDGALPEETAYLALLTALCGLDTGTSERDRQLARDYFRPAIRRLDTAAYLENPFYENIQIPATRSGSWELKYESCEPFEAFVCGDLIVEADFREIPPIGFFDETFRFPVVLENGREWMAIKPNEMETMRRAIDLVSGNVVTFGLGLGYFCYMASLKKSVEHVTVVERDDAVIQLFKRHVFPQFQHKDKIEIVSADAFDYIERRMPGQDFDCAFADLWHDASDGLECYLRIKKMEPLHPGTTFLYWIEDSLLSALRWRVFDRTVRDARSYSEIERSLSSPSLRELAVHAWSDLP